MNFFQEYQKRAHDAQIGEGGFVYVIGAGDRYSKIGVSHDPQRRIKSIATGCPLPAVLHYASPPMPVQRARLVEKVVHEALRDFRTAGEWFAVCPTGACIAVEPFASAPEYLLRDHFFTGTTERLVNALLHASADVTVEPQLPDGMGRA